MIKYSKIGQFRHFLKEVRASGIIELNGTVKVHGTNAGVMLKSNGDQIPQSRNRELSVEDDQYGFATWCLTKKQYFKELYESLNTKEDIVIFGEWAGKGIQKGVAVSEAEKFFYIFDFVFKEEPDIVYAKDIWTKTISIDLDNPKAMINELIEITNGIEKECPVGLHFGISDTGEGVVWTFDKWKFKVKGEKHSVTKVKKLASVDPEKLESIEKFVEYAVTENRLNQALEGRQLELENIGAFLKWLNQDIIAEESDTLKANGLTYKDVGKAVSNKAKKWYLHS